MPREMLSHEETMALVRRAQSGDEGALETLIEANEPLVRAIVGKRYRQVWACGAACLQRDDLMQEGRIALADAIRRFDFEKYGDVKLSTYAYEKIDGALQNAIKRQARPVRNPHHVEDDLARLAREGEADEEPESSARRDYLALLRELRARSFRSIDAPVKSKDGSEEPRDTLADKASSGFADRIVDLLSFKRSLSRLTSHERFILLAHHAVDFDPVTGEPLRNPKTGDLHDASLATFRDLGKALGVSSSGVEVVYRRALAKARREYAHEGLPVKRSG